MGQKVGWPRRRGVMGARHDLRGPAFVSFKLRLLLRTRFEKGRKRIFERGARHPFSSNSATRVSNSCPLSDEIQRNSSWECTSPSRSSLFAKDYRQRIAIKLDRRWMGRWIDRSIDRNAAKRTLWSVIDNERGGDDALKRALCPLLFNEDPIRVVMGADLYRS